MASNNEEINKGLEDMLDAAESKARQEVAAGTDEGHNNLVKDLEDLLGEAKGLAFHDQLNDEYEAPKVALNNKLLVLSARVKNGNYDN